MIDELLYEEGEPEENNRKPDMNSVVTHKWCNAVLRSIRHAIKNELTVAVLTGDFDAEYPIGAWLVLLDQVKTILELSEDYEKCQEILELKADVAVILLIEKNVRN